MFVWRNLTERDGSSGADQGKEDKLREMHDLQNQKNGAVFVWGVV